MKYFKEDNDWLIIDKENAIFIQDQSAIKCLYYYCLSFCLLFYKKIMSQKKKQVRENFRNEVFSRDENKCRKCGKKECGLDAHHITDRVEMPNGGYVKENGISLCAKCHKKAEVWHISGNLEFEEGFHPNDFYRLINSNYGLALYYSKELGS